jgi:hypothetical protein
VPFGMRSYRSYKIACRAADQFVAGASDGPWVQARCGFVLDLDPTRSWYIAPQWVFRYRNPQNGNESKRIYVSIPGYSAFSYDKVLDPVPLLGVRP